MKLQGRELRAGLQGDDVNDLQDELVLLGFSIAQDVRAARLFDDKATLGAVKQFQESHGLPATGVVDATTAELIRVEVGKRRVATGQFLVRGQVRDAADRPVPGILVRVFDKDMRTEEFLGEAKTDDQGRYQVPYTAKQFARAEKGTADLRVVLVNDDGLDIASSPIVFNAKPMESVDLSLSGGPRPPSECERLVTDLTPLVQEVPFTDLTEDDITFLAGETGTDAQHIRWLREAFRRSREIAPSHPEEVLSMQPSKAPTSAPIAISPAVFYGLFRQGLPMTLEELADHLDDALVAAIQRSTTQNIIPPPPENQIKALEAVLDSTRIGRVLTLVSRN